MSDRKWPVSRVGTRWLTYCPRDGWDEHDTAGEAERAFGAIVDHLRDESADGWYESADTAAWGVWIPIERLRLVATAWSDDDTGDGERCRDAGWDAMLDGVVERVDRDSAALDFCVSVEAGAHKAARERIAELESEVDRMRDALRAVADAADSWADDAYRHCVPLPRGCSAIADALGVTESYDDVTARDIAAALRAMVGVSDV